MKVKFDSWSEFYEAAEAVLNRYSGLTLRVIGVERFICLSDGTPVLPLDYPVLIHAEPRNVIGRPKEFRAVNDGHGSWGIEFMLGGEPCAVNFGPGEEDLGYMLRRFCAVLNA